MEPGYVIHAPDNVVETGHVDDSLTPINYGYYGRLESDGINHWHISFLKLVYRPGRAVE